MDLAWKSKSEKKEKAMEEQKEKDEKLGVKFKISPVKKDLAAAASSSQMGQQSSAPKNLKTTMSP